MLAMSKANGATPTGASNVVYKRIERTLLLQLKKMVPFVAFTLTFWYMLTISPVQSQWVSFLDHFC